MNLSNLDDTNQIYGYPLRIIVDKKGRLWPTPVLKIISYAEYRQSEPQRVTVSLAKNPYNYWIPCYFNPKHFSRARVFIDKGIMVLYTNGKKSEPFFPHAIITVFPKIINQTLLLIEDKLEINLKNLINCYCNFIHLFRKYLDEYNDLEKNINLEIKEFIASRNSRHRSNILDLGEFLVKISFANLKQQNNTFSDDETIVNLFDSLRKIFVKEFISRQFYWIFKNNREIAKSFYYYKNINIDECFNLMRGKLITLHYAILIANSLINHDVLQLLESNYGFLPQQNLVKIIDNIRLQKLPRTFKELLTQLTSISFNTENQVKKYLHNCCTESFQQNYTTFDPNYKQNQIRTDGRRTDGRRTNYYSDIKKENKKEPKKIVINNPYDVLLRYNDDSFSSNS